MPSINKIIYQEFDLNYAYIQVRKDMRDRWLKLTGIYLAKNLTYLLKCFKRIELPLTLGLMMEEKDIFIF